MPLVEVRFYQDERGVPVLGWLQQLRQTDRQAYAKCVARIRLLGEWGLDLRRPLADYLEQEVHELRVRRGHVNYRILYFFPDRSVAILVHACIKEDAIPRADMLRAIQRRQAFLEDPQKHTYEEDVPHA